MDYLREHIEGVQVITVNLEKASFLEANDFMNILDFEIEQGGKNILIDLSGCNYVDSVFLGSIIFALRKLVSSEGNIKLIKPVISQKNFDKFHSLRIFDVFNNKNEALRSFQKVPVISGGNFNVYDNNAAVNPSFSY